MRPAAARSLIAAVLALATPGAPALEFSSSFESLKIQARPGQTVTQSFQLHLAAKQPRVRFRARVEDWWQSEDGAQSFYPAPGTLSRSCGRWITLDPMETAVEPGGTLEVRVTTAVPAEVVPGGYWCVLTVQELPDPLAPTSGVDVRFLSSVSTGIFVYIDPVQRQVEISDIRTSARQVAVTLRNVGNAPAGVEGRIEVFPAGGQEIVATALLPRVTVLTEPLDRRRVTAEIPGLAALPAGRYRMLVVLDLGLDYDIGAQRELVIPRDLVSLPKDG
jgi:hypothetical protein